MISSVEKNANECLEAQVEEIEVLSSIYGDDWKTENEADRSYSIEIKEGDISATLYVTLPGTYPLESPPTYTLSAPTLTREHKNQLLNQLEEVYLQNIGQTVLFQWINKVKEFLSNLVLDIECILEEDTLETVPSKTSLPSEDKIPEIVHGETIVDKKSTFQGHVAAVFSVNMVRRVLEELKTNRKIANATHNMYAYRINHTSDTFIQDCDDDGETNAGSRLLHLLQILNASNVLVVVSRWYGGIHLGSDRFRHINNAARQALKEAGFINTNKKKS